MATKMSKTGYRLSPNEEAALIKQEKERRRKLRLQQVREQERHFASKIRSNVSKKKGEELKNLAQHLKRDWEEVKKEKGEVLQKMFERSLESVGDGHRAASNQPPLAEIRAAQALKDKHAASERYNSALKRQKQEDERHYLKENAHIIARKAAIQTEKVRAAKIASLHPPVKDPIEDLDDIGKENKVVTVISGFSTSHYHLKREFVERAEPQEQEDARLAAQEEERRIQEDEMVTEREEKERQEKARLRHQHARKQELLHQDYAKLMGELGQMEQADRRRRQAIVANIPHQVFQPPHKRLEDKQEEQQQLEQAFEDMYMANTDYTGDLILALEPKPKRDADLDVTIDSVSDDAGILLRPVPMQPKEREDERKTFPQGLDEEVEEVAAAKRIAEDKLRQPRAPLRMLMDRIKNQREELKKRVVLEVPSQERPDEEPETPHSSRDLPSQDEAGSQDVLASQDVFPPPGASQEDSGSERSTLDTLETGTLSEDYNKKEEKTTLLHPMEEAAKIRSASKMPSVQLQKKVQQDIMAKEDEQRLRLAEKQLQEHIDHRDHLQMLQDNLLQRQRMLQQQIEEQERLHREQLAFQKREFEQQQEGLWRDKQPTQSIEEEIETEQHFLGNTPMQNQGSENENVQAIQRLIRQLQVSDQQRQQQRALQQQLTQHADQQHDHTQYQELPENLLQQPYPLKQQQVEVPSMSEDVLLPRQRPGPQEGQGKDVSANAIYKQMDTSSAHKLPSSLEQPGQKSQQQGFPQTEGDSSQSGLRGLQIPITVQQGHSKEWLEQLTLDHQRSTKLLPDQARTLPPSQDMLHEAQVQLQQRRERIMQQYPELKLPPYEPYIKDIPAPPSTEPLKDRTAHRPMYPDTGLGKLPDSKVLPRVSGGLPRSREAITSPEAMMTTGVSSTGVMTTSVSTSRPTVTTLQSDVLRQSVEGPGTGPQLHEMEKQLEQHRQLLLKTRQQLQQQQQQQQQRILEKQRVLAQRIEQQKQEQLSRKLGEGMMSQPGTQEVLTSGTVTSQSVPQIVMSQPLPQHVMTSQPGTHEVITSRSNAQPKMTSENLGVLGVHEVGQTTVSEVNPSGKLSLKFGKSASESRTEDSSDKEIPSASQGIYKLPSMTFGQTSYPFDPTASMPGESTASEPPSFHQLSPDSSTNVTESSEYHPAEIASVSDDVSPSHGQSLQFDWATILASNTDPSKPSQPTLPSTFRSHRHTRPPPAQWRLPQPAVETAPHELSTILEAESPRHEGLSTSQAALDQLASTPHKTSPALRGTSQKDTGISTSRFHSEEHHLSNKASDMATTADQASGGYSWKTLPDNSHSQAHTDTSTSTSVPSFAMDVGQGVLSYPSSTLITMRLNAALSTATTVSVSTSSITSAPITSPAAIFIASPATNNEGASTQPDSSVSFLSDHTLPATQHSLSNSLISEKSVEQFLALSSYESSNTDSLSSTSARYQARILGSDKRPNESPIIKDFVTDIPSGGSWQPSLVSSLPPVTHENTIPSFPTAPRQSTESADYVLGPVSPQSTWTDEDTHSGSYLAGGIPAFPVMRRSDIPKDGMPMFSDVSLSHYNTSLESGPSVVPTDPGVQSHHAHQADTELYGSGSPGGESEKWFLPHQSLDNSELHQLNRGATLEPSPGMIPGDIDVRMSESQPEVKGEAVSDGESCKMSYAGAVIEESHAASEAMDDTLQEAIRNIALSESETSKETGIIEDPDLTLISLNTTLTSSIAPEDTNEDTESDQPWASGELGSDSLVSFLHHEEEISLESPARSGTDQSKLVRTGSPTNIQDENTPDASTDPSFSLQEAFKRHKRSFIESSQSRQLEVKVHAESHQATAFSQTLDNWKKSRGGRIQRSKTKTGKSPSKGPQVKGQRSGDRSRITTVTSADRKAAEKEMYQRNVRLYNQLQEVQKQKLTQKRQKEYATNRERRKEFEKKLQTRLSKMTKQTTQPSS